MKKEIFVILILLIFTGCAHHSQNDSVLALESKIDKNTQTLQEQMNKNTHSCISQNKEFLQQRVISKLDATNEKLEKLFNELEELKKVKPKIIIKDVKEKKEEKESVNINKIDKFEEKLVVGGVEKVQIYPTDFQFDARIDTGAETSSIDARDIKEFERDGKKWVSFDLIEQESNKKIRVEREIVRHVKIAQSLVDTLDRRVIVLLKLYIGDRAFLTEFTLTNRDHMNYPLLIGRNAIKDMMIVDVSRDFIAPLVIEDKNSE
ncbi:MAG: ATP-dependent zinc protease [Sulfurospirillaceae bacterium]|nr:ATP-dependent zinc protease [Sulfurospirillaceae bacterium]MCK9545164.1 ATP-dependent zinc protease [Sulfurospirillaceae bacterium]